MFGINGGEALVLLLVAVVVVGPERLPRYVQELGAWVREARAFVQQAKAKVDEELGAEAIRVDWQALDPRQYDPRRIVREALREGFMSPATGTAAAKTTTPTTEAPGPTSNGRAA